MSFRTRTHPADNPVDILRPHPVDKPSRGSSAERARHTKALTDARCVGQMLDGVVEEQAVAELQAGGQDVNQKRDAADDPTPATVGIEVLSGGAEEMKTSKKNKKKTNSVNKCSS